MLLLFVSIDIVTICSAKLRIVYHFLFVHQSIRVFVNARIWTSRLFLSNPEGSNISVSAVFHNCQHFCCDCCLFAKRNIDKNILPITNNINHYYRSSVIFKKYRHVPYQLRFNTAFLHRHTHTHSQIRTLFLNDSQLE